MHGHTDTDIRTRTLMEKTDTYGKDGHLWKRRTLMEKTDSYGKDGRLWKRQTLMEKTDTYGKDGHKAFETNFLSLNGCRTCLNQLQCKLNLLIKTLIV